MATCIIIPNYNHATTMPNILEILTKYNLPCIIIDDGSDADTKNTLKQLSYSYDWVKVLTLDKNSGKGEAVKKGLRYADAHGYSHAIQIDADGQHDLLDLPKFIQAITDTPKNLISGLPLYDNSVPKSRYYGRMITNFWVMIETISLTIKDAMCGFRVYPIKKTIEIMDKFNLGRKMDFDIEIMVKSYWSGIDIKYIPTKIIYPVGGTSHFKIGKDNLLISWMHTKLFFGMLPKLPKLLKRHYNTNQQKKEANKINHWSKVSERGSMFAMRIMLLGYKLLGKRITYWLLYPIIAYFYLMSRVAKKASKQYLANLNTYMNKKMPQQGSFQHFLTFGESAIDKLAVWNNEIQMEQIDFPNIDLFHQNVATKQGGIILSAHLGNIEIARALSRFEPNVVINALVFNQHAVKFNKLLAKLNFECKLNIIEIQNIDIQLAISLKDKVERGEFIVIMGDRTSATQPGRTIRASFLGQPANMPEGAFILAGLLKARVYFMLCLKTEQDRFHVVFKNFADSIDLNRKNRTDSLKHYVQKYADYLSDYAQKYPLQWFNFFDIWQPPEKITENNKMRKVCK